MDDAAAESRVKDAARYVMRSEDLELPKLFWQDLTRVLAVIVQEQGVRFLDDPGRFADRRLLDFIDSSKRLVIAEGSEWDPVERGFTWAILGYALQTAGASNGVTLSHCMSRLPLSARR